MRKALLLGVVGLIAAAVAVGAVLAQGPGPTVTTFVRANYPEPYWAEGDGIKLGTKGPTDHVVQTQTFAPGASSGWHHHPGVLVVSIASGTLTRYHDNCEPELIGPGQGFVEFGSSPVMVRNETEEDVVLYVTYIVPEGSPLRFEDEDPCGV